MTLCNFIDRNAGTLSKNRRLDQIFSSWQRMDPDKKQSFRDSASALLQKLDDGEASVVTESNRSNTACRR